MPSVPIVDAKGKSQQTLELSADVFGVTPRVPLLHQAVVKELAARRAGTHSTRGRSDVRGGGRKPWKQKGTGRARQGSIRATQWKGGGKPFGPRPRKYDKAMPSTMRPSSEPATCRWSTPSASRRPRPRPSPRG
jgi:large subunit ribosomal protein L4